MFERKLVDDKSRITALTLLEGQLSCQGTFDLPVLLFILPLTLQSEPFSEYLYFWNACWGNIHSRLCKMAVERAFLTKRIKNGETFSTKNSAIRLYSSTFIYMYVFPDLKIHSRSHRMVDCCVFVTISYSVTLLPVQIHVMGKAEGSKTKVRTSNIEMKQKWNIPKNTFST